MGYQENNGYIEVLSNYFSVDFNIANRFEDSFKKENLQFFFAACDREEILEERSKSLQDNPPATGGGGLDLLELCAPIVVTVFSPQNIQYIANSCISGALWDLLKFISLKITKQFSFKKETKCVSFHMTIHKDVESSITDIDISTSMSQEQVASCVREAILQGLSMKSEISTNKTTA